LLRPIQAVITAITISARARACDGHTRTGSAPAMGLSA
jgi:hypothetical protein